MNIQDKESLKSPTTNIRWIDKVSPKKIAILFFGGLCFIIFLLNIAPNFSTKPTKKPTLNHNLDFKECKIFELLGSEKDSENSEWDRLFKKYPGLDSKDPKVFNKERTLFVQDPIFKTLEKEAYANNKCSLITLDFLGNIFSTFNLKEKAKEYYRKSMELANKDKSSEQSIKYFCNYSSLNPLIPIEQKVHSCQIFLNTNHLNISPHDKHMTYNILASYFYENSNPKELNELCLKANTDDTKKVCIQYGQLLADKLETENKYEQAIQMYEMLSYHEGNSEINQLLTQKYQAWAEKYQKREDLDQAIYWYKKALKMSANKDERINILHNLGVIYNESRDYVNSFYFYREAAKQGDVLSQYNLSIKYTQGYGTIQDYKKAYAWISVAIANGLPDSQQHTAIENQTSAENFKTQIISLLKNNHSTGDSFKEAEVLAQDYFKKYVLHENPRIRSIEDLFSKVGDKLGFTPKNELD